MTINKKKYKSSATRKMHSRNSQYEIRQHILIWLKFALSSHKKENNENTAYNRNNPYQI